MRSTRVVATLVVLVCTGCMGDDSEQKRAEAAEWCRITTHLDQGFDSRGRRGPTDTQITYDRAADWVEAAPEEIRPATERAAHVLRALATDPPHPDLAPARVEIAEYAEDNCDEPTPCFGDVERNPKFPCLN
jgi:hypothetical protein